jgi:tetratricopeptide (TPR) repeat protein
VQFLTCIPVSLPDCRLQQHTEAAVAAAEAGNFPAAVAAFRLALQLAPGSAALHEQLAQCLMELEQHDAALEAAEAATALQPDVRRCGKLTSQVLQDACINTHVELQYHVLIRMATACVLLLTIPEHLLQM